MNGRKPSATRIVSLILLWLIAAIWAVPIYLLVVLSLKTPAQIAKDPFGLPAPPQWGNFVTAWEKTSGSSAPNLGLSMVNSAVITVIAVLLIVALGSAAGYYLGRTHSRRSTAVYLGFLTAVTVPIQFVIIPFYSVLVQFGFIGQLVPVALFYAGFLTPFAVFLCTGFARAIPLDFEEAARLDGCNSLQIFWYVVLPLLRPVLNTVAVLTGIVVWNDFFGQLVLLLSSGNETLPLTVFNFASQYASQYDLLAAGLVIATIPLLVFYLMMQRRIVEGFSAGVKG